MTTTSGGVPVTDQPPERALACELCRRLPPGHEPGCLHALAEQIEKLNLRVSDG